MTAALEGGEWSAARPDRTLPPGKTRYPFYRRLGGPQGRSWRSENLVPTGIRSRTVQPVVNHYTDWATRPTNMVYTVRFFFSSKCSLFHNSNVFGSCIIRILYTECAKIKKKIIPAPKGWEWVELYLHSPCMCSGRVRGRSPFFFNFNLRTTLRLLTPSLRPLKFHAGNG